MIRSTQGFLGKHPFLIFIVSTGLCVSLVFGLLQTTIHFEVIEQYRKLKIDDFSTLHNVKIQFYTEKGVFVTINVHESTQHNDQPTLLNLKKISATTSYENELHHVSAPFGSFDVQANTLSLDGGVMMTDQKGEAIQADSMLYHFSERGLDAKTLKSINLQNLNVEADSVIIDGLNKNLKTQGKTSLTIYSQE